MAGDPTPLSPIEGRHEPQREPTLRDYVLEYWQHRKVIGAITLAGVIVVAAVSFLWPPTYVGTTTLLPPSEEDTGFSVSALMRGIDIPGISVPSRSGPEDIAVAVLESQRLRSALIERFDLTDVYGVDKPGKASRILKKRSSFKLDPTGLVIISVKDRDPHRAADLANAYAEELDRFNREVRTTKGRRKREFVEKRLEETQQELVAAEQALLDYQAENRAVVLTPEQSSTVETAAMLFSRQTALRVQLGMVKEYATENSEEVRRIRRELEQIERQIASLPDLGLDLARLLRNVRIQEQVYALLSAQYEEARIDEARDVPTLEVLDVAGPPDRRQWPRRGLLIGIGMILSLAGAVLWVRFTQPAPSLRR